MNLTGKQFFQPLRYSFTSHPLHSHILCVVYSSSFSSSSCTRKHRKCQERNKYRPKNEERINSKCKNLYTPTIGSDGKDAEASSRKRAFAHVICIVFMSHPHIFGHICPGSEVASKMLSEIWMRVSGSLLCTEARTHRTPDGSRPSQTARI
jgi:hypothetical protein